MIKMMVYFFLMLYGFIFLFLGGMIMFYLDISMLVEWSMFSVNSFEMKFIMLLDWISLLFMSVVLMIASKVMFYSVGYMNNEKFIMRFMWLMIMFIMSMILMIISPNVLSILFGWDGLGLVSFCLVIYYQSHISCNSGMVTVLLNRVGDIGILVMISLGMMNGSWSLLMFSGDKLELYLMVLAMITKSAQIPFSLWLPLAMAAPTPISALVHSSTLVTAGVYLMIRFNQFFMKEGVNFMILFLGVMTMLMAGGMANLEVDLKKIIALSTLSQLGLMMMILSLGSVMLGFFHLLIHAIFKSLLFMCAGVMIHLMNNNQDIRLLGGLMKSVPYLMMVFLVTNMALCGFPFMAGFYSKDLIMEMVYNSALNIYILILILISLSFTVMYSFRLVYFMFYSSVKFYSYLSMSEDKGMNLSMLLLLILSIIMGSLMSWGFFFDFYSFYLSMNLKLLTFFLCIGGLVISMGMVKGYMILKNFYYLIYYFSYMWFMNYLYLSIYDPFIMLGTKFSSIDKMWFEFTFKDWGVMVVKYLSKKNFFNIYMFMYIYIMLVYMNIILY